MKLSKSVFAILFLFSIMITQAQDIIYKTDGSSLKVKITEINSTSIKYKPAIDNSPTGEINKNDVNYILYQNGTKEYYNTNASPANTNRDYVSENREEKKVYGKNIIAINWFQFFFVNFGMSYERVLPSGKLSFKIPFDVSLGGMPIIHEYSNSGSTDFLQNKNYDVGLEINAYPFGQTRHTFYVGVSGVTGSFNYYTLSPTYSSYYPYQVTSSSYEKHTGVHYSALLHLGGYIGLSDHLLLGGKFGVGFKREDIVNTDNYTKARVQLDLNLAYRF